VLAEFSTFTEELLVLRDWLVAHGVTRVGMEATGVYWKPVVRHEALFDREGMKGPLLRVVVATR
jgi:transposase